jgi:hypothetical protein
MFASLMGRKLSGRKNRKSLVTAPVDPFRKDFDEFVAIWSVMLTLRSAGRRIKNGTPSTHPIRGDELRATPATGEPVLDLCLRQRAGIPVHHGRLRSVLRARAGRRRVGMFKPPSPP